MDEVRNAVGYIRVSTDMQIDGYSLEGQLKEIRDYCGRNRINLIRYYEDAGKSGTSIENRDAFNKMMEDISLNKNIHAIIVWKLSRLSRNISDVANMIKFIEKHDVNLICITQGLDTSTQMGKSFVYMAGIFAELERDNIVEASKMGMKQRAMEGKWNGGQVFGYRSDDNSKLVIVEEEANIIREIFSLFIKESFGYKKIASLLNQRGLRTLRDADWSIQSIKQIVDNPLYAGYIRWGKYIDWSKKRRKGKQDEYVLVKGIHEPIITDEVWENTQEIRSIRGKQNERIYEGNFMLTGLMKCPVCGATMISHRKPKKGKDGEYYRYYQCSNFFNKGSNVCKSNLINADLAEEDVLNRLNEIVKTKEVIDTMIEEVEKRYYIDKAPLEIVLKNLEGELIKINKKKSENFQLELDDKIDIDTLNERVLFLKAKEEEINKKIYDIKIRLVNINNNINIEPNLIRKILEDFNTVFENVDIEDKKILLRSIIESISITNGNSSRDRRIDKVKLHFRPEEIQALDLNKKCVIANSAVNRIINNPKTKFNRFK